MNTRAVRRIARLHLGWLQQDDNGEQADCRGASLIGADFSNQNLQRANFSDANLTKANFTNANLCGANLRGADLTGAILMKADLTHADLSGACFKGADLRKVNFFDANLLSANFNGANLTGADLDYSAWPLWCGSMGVKVGVIFAAQLAAHFCALDCGHPNYQKARKAILKFARTSHRAKELRIF